MTERERTRYCIETALIKLMETKSIEKITISEICEKAGVARASFYRNYQNKHDVVASFLESQERTFWDRVRFVPRSVDDYGLICRAIFEQTKSVCWRYEAFRRSHLTNLLYQFMTQAFLKRMDVTHEGESINYVAVGYAGALANIIINWLEEDCATPVDQVAHAMMSIIFPRADELSRLRGGIPVALVDQ